MFWGGRGWQGCPLTAIKEIGLKEWGGRCIAVWGLGEWASGGCRTCLRGKQQRTRGAVEAPEVEGRVEVMWLRKGEEGEKGGQVVSEVLCLRHGGRLREAGEDAQHGSVLSQETLVHPPQGLDLSQSRESLHRGGQRYREGPAEKACREGRAYAKRKTHIETVHISTHTGMCPHTYTDRGKEQQIWRDSSSKLMWTSIHTTGRFGEEIAKAATSKGNYEASCLWVCAHQTCAVCGERWGAKVVYALQRRGNRNSFILIKNYII